MLRHNYLLLQLGDRSEGGVSVVEDDGSFSSGGLLLLLITLMTHGCTRIIIV